MAHKESSSCVDNLAKTCGFLHKLSASMEHLSGGHQPFAAHLKLTKGERSELAGLAADLL